MYLPYLSCIFLSSKRLDGSPTTVQPHYACTVIRKVPSLRAEYTNSYFTLILPLTFTSCNGKLSCSLFETKGWIKPSKLAVLIIVSEFFPYNLAIVSSNSVFGLKQTF